MGLLEPIAPRDLRERLQAGDDLVLLDVREADEFAFCRIEGSVSVPLSELSVRHVELDPDLPTVCICHHGIRSASAAQALAHLGFDELYNLTGGVERWAAELDPLMPRY